MRYTAFLIIFFMTSMQFIAYGMNTATDKTMLLNKEIKNLQATYAAWQRNDAEFRNMRKQNTSATTEISEFAAYVAGLKRQVLEGCETVRSLGGDANQHGVDCIQLANEQESQASAAIPPEMPERQTTDEERKDALEQQLEALIGDFDKMILSEQEEIKEQERVSQAGGSGACSGGGQPGDTAEGTGAPPGEPGTAKDGEEVLKAEPGAGPGTGKKDVPEFEKNDVGDGSDDDIVARQLREAAEAETDPVLKAQLWEEYKKYKNSTR